MIPKERILAIRLGEKARKNVEYAKRIGLDVKEWIQFASNEKSVNRKDI